MWANLIISIYRRFKLFPQKTSNFYANARTNYRYIVMRKPDDHAKLKLFATHYNMSSCRMKLANVNFLWIRMKQFQEIFDLRAAERTERVIPEAHTFVSAHQNRF